MSTDVSKTKNGPPQQILVMGVLQLKRLVMGDSTIPRFNGDNFAVQLYKTLGYFQSHQKRTQTIKCSVKVLLIIQLLVMGYSIPNIGSSEILFLKPKVCQRRIKIFRDIFKSKTNPVLEVCSGDSAPQFQIRKETCMY